MIYFICFCITLSIVSCKKKDYPPSTTEGEPVFYCNMMVNGSPVELKAGINNYLMQASFIQDTNNVYRFMGELKSVGCTNCPNSLQIGINDAKVSALNGGIIIDSALMLKNYTYFGSNYPMLSVVQFQSTFNKTVASYLWDFGDGVISNLASPTHTYTQQKKYTVSLTVNSTNNCVSTISNTENLSNANKFFRATITTTNTGVKSVAFSATTFQGIAPLNYWWNFGDGSPLVNAATPSHTYAITGGYPVSLKIVDVNNDTTYANYNLITQNDVSSCASNYKINAVTTLTNTLGLSTINISWTDANGIVYHSKNGVQPNTSYFKITSIDAYDRNENNELIKKIRVQFSCKVYNGSSAIVLNNADAVIGVAYK
jgi:hypothetical protein